MSQHLRAEQVIAEVCAAALVDGSASWSEMRKAIRDRIERLPDDARNAVENELRLMVCREEDQAGVVVPH